MVDSCKRGLVVHGGWHDGGWRAQRAAHRRSPRAGACLRCVSQSQPHCTRRGAACRHAARRSLPASALPAGAALSLRQLALALCARSLQGCAPGSQSTAPAQSAAPGWSCRCPSPPAAPAWTAPAARSCRSCWLRRRPLPGTRAREAAAGGAGGSAAQGWEAAGPCGVGTRRDWASAGSARQPARAGSRAVGGACEQGWTAQRCTALPPGWPTDRTALARRGTGQRPEPSAPSTPGPPALPWASGRLGRGCRGSDRRCETARAVGAPCKSRRRACRAGRRSGDCWASFASPGRFTIIEARMPDPGKAAGWPKRALAGTLVLLSLLGLAIGEPAGSSGSPGAQQCMHCRRLAFRAAAALAAAAASRLPPFVAACKLARPPHQPSPMLHCRAGCRHHAVPPPAALGRLCAAAGGAAAGPACHRAGVGGGAARGRAAPLPGRR